MAEQGVLKPAAPQFALDTWANLPEDQRNIGRLNSTLAELGYESIKKATFYRWLKKPPAVEAARQVIRRAAAVPAAQGMAQMVDLGGVPDGFIDAFGLRVLLVAKGSKAHDEAEAAIVSMIGAIAANAKEIASQLTMPETEVVDKDGNRTITRHADGAKVAVEKVATLVDALHRVTASRMLPSLAHRNFAEGDRLSGEGKKFEAEADTIRQTARADNAKTINQPSATGHGQDIDYENEALSALRDIEKGR